MLTRKADDPRPHSSLLPLPHRYVVPGGRFREVYYWDSYFTMLGLEESGRHDLVADMARNFAWLIDEFRAHPERKPDLLPQPLAAPVLRLNGASSLPSAPVSKTWREFLPALGGSTSSGWTAPRAVAKGGRTGASCASRTERS